MVPRRIIRQTGLVFLASLCFIFLNVTFMVEWRDDVSWIPYEIRDISNSSFWIPLPDGKMVFYTNFTFMPFMPKYVLNNPDICQNKESVFFLVMVHTAVFHFDQREFLRRTWANKDLLRSHVMRILFLVGLPRESLTQERLQKENDENRDIVQGDFIDDYHNLTHKGVMGFKWISENCKNAKYVIKIDDDVFVNIFHLIETVLPVVETHPRHIFCHTRGNNTVARDGRHAVDVHYFPGVRRLPFPFCAGPFVLIPNAIVTEMYVASLSTPFLWLDDVYLFGILPLITGNISLYHLPKCHEDPKVALGCFSSKAQCDILAAFAWDEKAMFSLWNYNLKQCNERLWRYV
ncbi:hypothetical protein CHS0354_030710 [Potamilus streckersoni]|uniref:Hexosyltransferase n=1 Tax=Potamilus streckersoni TaxID=2493646 RepID=A0AAE0SML7_9BIVA|nr:hypothetical protein CHS0354_030710 [Potamilus streckersoni]